MPRTEAERAYHREYQRAWVRAHPERARATAKKTYDKTNTPEKRARIAAMRRRLRAADPTYSVRAYLYSRKKRYGLTPEAFDALLAEQGRRCAMCHEDLPENPRRISVDHDHKTGRVRGLVHQPCNMAIGFYEKYGELPQKYLAPAPSFSHTEEDVERTISAAGG